MIAALEMNRGRSRRLIDLMVVYLTGLILLEKHQPMVYSTILSRRARNALHRLLRVLPWSPHQLIVGQHLFAKVLTGGGWTYTDSRKPHSFGFGIVVLFWRNNTVRIPVAFCLWCPKRQDLPAYPTELEFAQNLITNGLRAGLSYGCLSFDSGYDVRPFTK